MPASEDILRGENREWLPLSSGTDGAPFNVSAENSGDATVVHVSSDRGFDRVWLWACSIGAETLLTLEWTTAGAGDLDILIPANTTSALSDPIVDGLLIANSTDIQAYAGAANLIHLTGYVQRYT